MSDAPSSTSGEDKHPIVELPPTLYYKPAAFQYKYAAEVDDRTRLQRALFQILIFARTAVIGTIVFAVLLVLLDLLFPFFLPFSFLFFFGYLLLFAGTSYYRSRRTALTLAYYGAEWESGFGSAEMVLKSPLGKADASYRVFEELRELNGFVFLRHRKTRVYSIAPVGLFPGELLAFVRDRIANA